MSSRLKYLMPLITLIFLTAASCSTRTPPYPDNTQMPEQSALLEQSTPEMRADKVDMIPSIMVAGKSLRHTGRTLDAFYNDYIYMLESPGKISSKVPSNKLPENDNESNSMEIGADIYVESTPNGSISHAYVKEPDTERWIVFEMHAPINHESMFYGVGNYRLYFLRIESSILTSHGYYIESNLFDLTNWTEYSGIEVVSLFWPDENQTTLPLTGTGIKTYIQKDGDTIISAYIYDDLNNRYYFFENYLSSKNGITTR